MDIEFQRMKERLETIHLILDDMQVCIGQFITTTFKQSNILVYFFTAVYSNACYRVNIVFQIIPRILDKRLHMQKYTQP